MKTLYEIEIDVITDTGEVHSVPPEVVARLAANQVGRSNAFRFDDWSQLQEAESFLRTRGTRFQRFYRFTLGRDEVATYPGFYLGSETLFDLMIDGRVEVKTMKRLDIALDYGSDRLIMTQRLQAALSPITRCLAFQATTASDGRGFAILHDMGLLPDPIAIPNPVEISPKVNAPDTYAVRSDGRDVLSDRNREQLARMGIARTAHVMLPGKKVVASPRWLVSGLVLDAMLRLKAKGLLARVPLLETNHPALSV